MPTYGYRCDQNGHEFEVVQAMTEAPLATCIECGAPVHRIFYPVGIVFKGQGFYKTDNRSSSSTSSPSTGEGSAAKTESSGATGASAKPDSGGGKADVAAKAETKP